jgi:two-component system, OmpR family, sensor histidine kinase VicK
VTLISDKEKTEVWQGVEEVVSKSLQVLYKIQKTCDLCTDANGPSVILSNEVIAKAYSDLKKREINVRFITEITRSNIRYCKEMMEIAEVRHLDGIKGSLVIADGTDYAGVANTQEAQPITQLIVSNVRAFVEQQQYFFETLWGKAAPALQRMVEIEKGAVRRETRVLDNPDEILAEMKRMNDDSNEMCICATSGGLHFTRSFLYDVTKRLLERSGKGNHKGVRYITNINGENVELVREFLDLGMQVRHVKNAQPMSFGISEKEMGATVELLEGGRMVQSLLMSNEPLYIQHFQSIFEGLWKSGLDAADRIKEIEQGIEPADIEIIRNPQDALGRAWNLMRSPQHEVLLMFSTTGAFQRQLKMGGLQVLTEAVAKGAKVMILLPAADEQVKSAIAKLGAQMPDVGIRALDKSLQTRITMLVVDRRECMLFELKDDTKDNSYEAVGVSMYSDSKTIVHSYASIFDSLWKQTELYQQLADANEQLKVHDRMQREFINIAAHELRTPIQPILGMAEMLEAELGDKSDNVKLIARNARRLEQLTRNILDVTIIESQSFTLDIEEFDLNDVILNTIEDYSDNLNASVKLLYQPVDVFVMADKERVMQVISNLLGNAFKFTTEGAITITTQRSGHEVIVAVSDTGSGIDQEILPRLFMKFATKSSRGTGLGLFISKSIVEAHGGRIWAENNDGKGATVSFSLPAQQ